MTEDIATLTPLEQLNLDVAAIAGWENIEEWNPNPKTRKPKRTFTGTNKKHPELGIHIPDYTSDLNAIANALNQFRIDWTVSADGDAFSLSEGKNGLDVEVSGETPAIALCKLLLELASNLPKSEPEIQVIDDDGDVDAPTVIEATFG